MDPQPAFLNRAPFEPLAGPEASKPEDPEIAIPVGVLQPDPPEADRLDDKADAEVQPATAEPDHANEAAGSTQKWSLAFGASLLFHAAVAAVLILAPESILPPRVFDMTVGGEGKDDAKIGNSGASLIFGAKPPPDVTNVTVVPERELRPPRQAQPQLKKEPHSQPAETESPSTNKSVQKKSGGSEPEILHDRQTQAEEGALALQEMAPKATLEILRPVMPEPSEAERQLTEQQATTKPKSQPAPDADGQADINTMRGAGNGNEDGRATDPAAGDVVAESYENSIFEKLAGANRRISQVTQAEATRNAGVSFVINTDGSVTDIKLEQSSGSETLDKLAVSMVRRLAPFPPIPPETGKKFWLQEFSLGPF